MSKPKFNPKNKPSEEIEKRAKELAIEICETKEDAEKYWPAYSRRAILEYLDWKWEEEKK